MSADFKVIFKKKFDAIDLDEIVESVFDAVSEGDFDRDDFGDAYGEILVTIEYNKGENHD